MHVRSVFGFLTGLLLLGVTANVGVCVPLSSVVGEKDPNEERPLNWGWALTYGRAYDNPVGTYYTNVERGIGSEFRLARAVSKSTALRLTFSHYGMDFKFGTEFEVARNVDGQLTTRRMTEPQLHVYSLAIGAQHQRWLDRLRRNRTRVCFSMDVGVARHETSGNFTVWTAGTDEEVITYHASEYIDLGMLRTGGGFIFPVGHNFQLDVGADIGMIWVRKDNAHDVRQIVYGIKGFILRLTGGLTLTI